MLNPKEWVFDRIEQTFILFKNNFKNIFLGYFLYNFMVFIIIWNIIYYWILKFVDLSSFNFDKSENIIADLFSNTYFIIWVNIFLILLLLNLILVIPFILGTIKTIKEAFEGKENIDFLKNIRYWFKNINNSFRVYWYIFVYVALVPSIFIIIWWLLLILWQVKHIDILLQFWIFILSFSFLFLMIFMIYKWLKTKFSIISAVDKDNYSKENFDFSVSITNWNWLRIIGNLMFVWIIISLVVWIFNSIISLFDFSNNDNINFLKDININEIKQEEVENIILNLNKSFMDFSISTFLINIVKLIINVVSIMFVFTFNYIFFKRLEYEYKVEKTNDIWEKLIEEL